MKFFGRTTRGDVVEVDVALLIARTAWLSGGKIVPPISLSNALFSAGSARYDHWREITWPPFELTPDEYESIRQQLMERFGFVSLDHLEHCVSRVEWEAHQTARQTGKSYEDIFPLVARMDALDKAKSALEGSGETEIEEMIDLKRMEIISALQS